MKKLILITTVILFFTSCSMTTTSQDTQMLQQHYKTVYNSDVSRFITIDSTNRIYDIKVTYDGKISSIVEIK